MLVDLGRLERDYFDRHPDMNDPAQIVSFGTSGHRGTSLERHVYRSAYPRHHAGHLRLSAHGREPRPAVHGQGYARALGASATHRARSSGGERRGNDRPSRRRRNSYARHFLAILTYNRGRKLHLADGIVITPSHNPPEDGGFKYNPTNGGPAETDVTNWIQDRANQLLRDGNRDVKRVPLCAALKRRDHASGRFHSALRRAILQNIVDMDAIRAAGLKLGVDPLGGASLPYWEPINSIYKLNITVVNPKLDPTFSFMTVDHDGKIRMDCSSPYAMASLVGLKDKFRVAFANDPDSDRHGIVTPSAGLMNPNHYLAVAIQLSAHASVRMAGARRRSAKRWSAAA